MADNTPPMTTEDFILFNTAFDAADYTNPAHASVARNAAGRASERKYERAVNGGWVTYRPKAWYDRQLTKAEQADFARALKSLERQKLVETEKDGTGRTNWLRLTTAGNKRANAVAKEQGLNIPPKRHPVETLRERLEWLIEMNFGKRRRYIREELAKLPEADLDISWGSRLFTSKPYTEEQLWAKMIVERIRKGISEIPQEGEPYYIDGKHVGYTWPEDEDALEGRT